MSCLPKSIARAAALGASLLSAFVLGPTDAHAQRSGRPYRGAPEFVAVLCQSSDYATVSDAGLGTKRPWTLPTPAQVRAKLFDRGGMGVADFFHDWSNGLVSMERGRVFGWYTLSLTRAQWNGLSRNDKPDACIAAARNDPQWRADPPQFPIFIVVAAPQLDLYGNASIKGNRLAFLPEDVDIGAAAHEIGHAMGLPHVNNRTLYGASKGRFDEYGDPWDVMSWANNYSVQTSFGGGPAGLSAAFLEHHGWLPSTRTLTFGADGRTSASYCLAPLNDPSQNGWLQVRVFPNDTASGTYFSIEARAPDKRWGGGIPMNVGARIRIHAVTASGSSPFTNVFLYGEEPPANSPWIPADRLDTNGIAIRANQPTAACPGSVTITDRRPMTSTRQAFLSGDIGINRCRSGFVRRELDPYDYVCVEPRTKAMHQAEGSLWPRVPGSVPLGCAGGQVFRQAYPGDWICVPPASRDQAARDNAAATQRFVRP